MGGAVRRGGALVPEGGVRRLAVLPLLQREELRALPPAPARLRAQGRDGGGGGGVLFAPPRRLLRGRQQRQPHAHAQRRVEGLRLPRAVLGPPAALLRERDVVAGGKLLPTRVADGVQVPGGDVHGAAEAVRLHRAHGGWQGIAVRDRRGAEGDAVRQQHGRAERVLPGGSRDDEGGGDGGEPERQAADLIRTVCGEPQRGPAARHRGPCDRVSAAAGGVYRDCDEEELGECGAGGGEVAFAHQGVAKEHVTITCIIIRQGVCYKEGWIEKLEYMLVVVLRQPLLKVLRSNRKAAATRMSSSISLQMVIMRWQLSSIAFLGGYVGPFV